MRILHLLGVGRLSPNPDEQSMGGLTRTVLSLARIQAKNGHDVSVVTPDTSSWSTDWNGVHLVGVSHFTKGIIKRIPTASGYLTHAAIAYFVARRQFDVIQGHNYPYFRFIHAPRRVVTFHIDPFYYGWTQKDFSVCKKYGTHFVAVSDFVSSAVSKGLNVPRATVPVVHNGVDHSIFRQAKPTIAFNAKQWRANLGIRSNQVLFLYAGAMTSEKGTRELALAFRKLLSEVPNSVLVLAGTSHMWGHSGEQRERSMFEKDVRSILDTCQENVRYLDNVLGSDMPTVYTMADAVVVPSTYKEAFGLVALESIACGRPVIASRIGGLPEIIDSNCGILVEAGNVDLLYRAMHELANQPAARREKGIRGAQKARTFSWERGVSMLDEVYQS